MQKFKIEDKEYVYDEKISVEDAMFIWEKAKVGVVEFGHQLFNVGNPYAIAAWVYLLKRRAGEAARWEDVLKMNIRTFEFIPGDQPEPSDETDDAGKPDPTEPTSRSGGKTRRSGTGATS